MSIGGELPLDFTIKPADLILVRGDGLIDKAIEEISHSPYSHVAGLVKPNELIEAQAFRRTGYQGLDYYHGVSDVFTCDSLTDEQRNQIVAFVMKEVGTEYDYLLIPWEFEHYVFHVDLPFAEDDARHDCSTLWSDAYRSVGVDLCPGVKYPTPGDLGTSMRLRKLGSY